ncbi:MAG: N-acetyl-gamma-glutamyl-phosphate reductase [Peptococcaceae bacterium BICA1-8]|nr:MAG: N-acetyl-gamma-glutamyl-phosphate reductase [Peptococcaceae bacterium BICA1-8]
MKIQAGIIGVTGYTGGELLRLLLNHPLVDIRKAASRSNAGNEVTKVHPHLTSLISLVEDDINSDTFAEGLDVVFLALPHGKSVPLVKKLYEKGVKIIDLGADFRLKSVSDYKEWYELEHEYPELLAESVYGLPEIYKETIKKSTIVANPGCYPTSIILGLAPLLKNNLINLKNIIIDSKSGISGAGKTLSQQTHYPDMNDNLLAYKVGNHRHTPEIEQELSLLSSAKIQINFTPHLIPMNRGMLSTIYAEGVKSLSQDELGKLYGEYYKDCPFVRIRGLDSLPQTKWVQGSNYCDIAPVFDERTGRIIIISALDNLVKGASGQAIQNMNLMFGLEETTGLKYAAIYP